jgi:hypothetical protein
MITGQRCQTSAHASPRSEPTVEPKIAAVSDIGRLSDIEEPLSASRQ